MKYSYTDRWTALSLLLMFSCQCFQAAAISMSKCVLWGIAKLCLSDVILRRAVWSEELSLKTGRSSCCDRCTTPDPVTDASHTAVHQRYLWQQPRYLPPALLSDAWGYYDYLNAHREYLWSLQREYLYLSEWIITDHLWTLKYCGIVQAKMTFLYHLLTLMSVHKSINRRCFAECSRCSFTCNHSAS